ncbi:hypothetical protein ACFSJW_14925 [Flavobacterium artemisiae]|uniref:Peptidase M48 domain-containing protein n=1 Tax=Flavobacterium artemisiae TaxID=2126556 RepID=A0ABW4HHY8_9FLAO
MRYIIFFLLLSVSGFSQVYYCSYSGGACDTNMINPTPTAVQVVEQVCYVLGITTIPIYQSGVSDACAFADSFGNRCITYNANFLGYLHQNNVWGPISVLAHEVGHHYSMHSSWYGSFMHPWTRELQADYVSGYVLYKLGCPSLDDAHAAFRLLFSYTGTNSHPDTPSRMDALAQGYIRASQGF